MVVAVVVIIVYCREYIILSCGVGSGRVGGGGSGVGGGGSVNGSSCKWLWLLFIVDSVYIILL